MIISHSWYSARTTLSRLINSLWQVLYYFHFIEAEPITKVKWLAQGHPSDKGTWDLNPEFNSRACVLPYYAFTTTSQVPEAGETARMHQRQQSGSPKPWPRNLVTKASNESCIYFQVCHSFQCYSIFRTHSRCSRHWSIFFSVFLRPSKVVGTRQTFHKGLWTHEQDDL